MLSKVKNWFIKVEKEPIIILGNQKSGTSAITHLLADCCGLSKTVDIPPTWPPYTQKLILGEEKLVDLVKKYPKYFSKKVIKEPNLTFVSEQVLQLFPKGRYIFIVRDPRDNIRSLLNRRNIPGNLDQISNIKLELEANILFDKEVWGGAGENYIGVLAHRWNKAIKEYKKNSDSFHLLKYEDFCLNKSMFIESLATELGCKLKNDISNKVDFQFQPPGDNNINWKAFFGNANLAQINEICESNMSLLGYKT